MSEPPQKKRKLKHDEKATVSAEAEQDSKRQTKSSKTAPTAAEEKVSEKAHAGHEKKEKSESGDEGDEESEEEVFKDKSKPPKDKSFHVEGSWPRVSWNGLLQYALQEGKHKWLDESFIPIASRWKHWLEVEDDWNSPLAPSYVTPVEDAIAALRAKRGWTTKGLLPGNVREGAVLMAEPAGSPDEDLWDRIGMTPEGRFAVQFVADDNDARFLYIEDSFDTDGTGAHTKHFIFEIKSEQFAAYFLIDQYQSGFFRSSAFDLIRPHQGSTDDVDMLPRIIGQRITLSDILIHFGRFWPMFANLKPFSLSQLDDDD